MVRLQYLHYWPGFRGGYLVLISFEINFFGWHRGFTRVIFNLWLVSICMNTGTNSLWCSIINRVWSEMSDSQSDWFAWHDLLVKWVWLWARSLCSAKCGILHSEKQCLQARPWVAIKPFNCQCTGETFTGKKDGDSDLKIVFSFVHVFYSSVSVWQEQIVISKESQLCKGQNTGMWMSLRVCFIPIETVW